MVNRRRLYARGLILVFALALAALGFGHRFASAAQLERAQFAQAFGGASFCRDGDAGGAPGASASCPVCHVIASAGAPPAVAGVERPVFAPLALALAAPQAAPAGTRPRGPPPLRGPPLI